MPAVSGTYPSPWALGLSASHERQSAAEFFETFPWEGPGDEEVMSSGAFFDAFCDDPPESSAPPTLRGYQVDRRSGER